MTHAVVVVGGGVIGLGIAWRCAQQGLAVRLVDPAPGTGASATAAGMLAPVTELHYGEQPLLQLNLDSARRYPGFAAELADVTGRDIGYRRSGTLVAAWDHADLAALRDLRTFGATLGVASDLVNARELRRLEPGLATGLAGGLFAADDHQVDNRALHDALRSAGLAAGVQLVAEPVVELLVTGDRAQGVRVAGGTQLDADITVLAAGAWTSQLPGLPRELLPPVRPVKGQTLRLRTTDMPVIEHIVRGSVKGSPVYLVPRDNGEIVIGGTVEEAGFDTRPRAGAVYELLRDAQSLVPLVGEIELAELCTGLRPGTPDNAPLLGPTGVDGLVAATGHYRNGILLTPVTADGIAELITTGVTPDVLAPFRPDRFAGVQLR